MNYFHIVLLLFFSSISTAQQIPQNWYHLDFNDDGIRGASIDKAYANLIKNTGQTIVVAIIDSGVEVDHEDLDNVIWVNPDEVPNNGKDDDGNGYIDDIHGWNFIGGSNGKNVHYETLEITRLYAKYKYKYENADRSQLTKSQKKEFDTYIKYRDKVESERNKAQTNLERLEQSREFVMNSLNALVNAIGSRPVTNEVLDSLSFSGNPIYSIGINIWKEISSMGEDPESFEDLRNVINEEFTSTYDYYNNKLQYHFNPEFDSRKIVQDNYADPYESNYGNNDVEGPFATHGTHVAGIVAAERNNGIGINGIASNVRIMAIRAVPDGDERDKDVANAIKYAVDNGASIVNMSFGKGQSWNKQVVDEAVKYAQKHDVLLVHASGNGGQNIDIESNFPSDIYEKKGLFCKKTAKNWIEVGALSYENNENMIATFSNYSSKEVDVFAPGVSMYSTVVDNGYESLQGTSFAAPVVAGVAAIIRSQYPELSACQVKEILMDSATPIERKVKRPGDGVEVSPKELSVTGGHINAYEALKLAAKTKAKKTSTKKRKWNPDNAGSNPNRA